MSFNFTNESTFWFWCLHDLFFSRSLFEPASDWRRTNKGWGCLEKDVETKRSKQYIKNKLQQLKLPRL